MKLFIVGGTRFIGRRLASTTDSAVFSRGNAPIKHGRHYPGDRLDVEAMKAAIQDFQPDAVVDMILWNPDDLRVTLTAAGDLPVVAVSSIDVMRNFGILLRKEAGPPDPLPLDESSPVRTQLYPYRSDDPETPAFRQNYDKIPVEELAVAEGHTVVRLPMVFGPDDHQFRLFPTLKALSEGEPITLGPLESGFIVPKGYVDSMAALILAAAEKHPGGRFMAADWPAMPETEWRSSIAAALGVEPIITRGPESEDADFSSSISIRLDRSINELGWTPRTDLKDCLQRTIRYEIEAHPDSSDGLRAWAMERLDAN